MRSWSIALWMALALLCVGLLAAWDATRESTNALDDFSREQVMLARALAGVGAADPSQTAVVDAMRAIEQPHALVVLFLPAGETAFRSTHGERVESAILLDAIGSNATSLRLTREQSASLNLSRRMAMVGFSRIETGAQKGGIVAVVASAERERDRERRAFWRLLLSVALAAALVLAFGGLALKNQRKELALEHDLAIAAIQEERDRKLAVADKVATMGALATGIAHEVSTPLGVIVGRAEQLQAKVTDEKDKRAVAAILEQSDRISRIVRGLLGLARGDSPAFERVSAASIAEKACALVRHRFDKAQVSLEVDLADELPFIACEPRLLEQALVNLLLNACDACAPSGRVVLHASDETANGSKRVSFRVEDDGEGISAESAARATEAFFTTKAAGSGTGLGLAIANEIVKHHGGTIAIAAREENEKHGTVARIDVPASEAL